MSEFEFAEGEDRGEDRGIGHIPCGLTISQGCLDGHSPRIEILLGSIQGRRRGRGW